MNTKKLFIGMVASLSLGLLGASAQEVTKHAKDTVVVELPKLPHEVDADVYNLQNPNVISINLLGLAALAMPEIQYERTLSESLGVGARGILQFDMSDFESGWGPLSTAQLQTFSRWYFKPYRLFRSQVFSSFFIEGMLGYKASKALEVYDRIYDHETIGSGTKRNSGDYEHSFGIGAGCGWRFQSSDGKWVGESSVSLGRSLVGKTGGMPMIFSGGLKIGYRF